MSGTPKHAAEDPCPDHTPVQHRDGKPPWCPNCKLTALWQRPISRLDENGLHPVSSES